MQLVLAGGTYTGSSSGLTGYETFDLSLEAWYVIAAGTLSVVALLAWGVLPGPEHRPLADRAAGSVRRRGQPGGVRLWRVQRRGGAGADRIRVRHGVDHLGGAGRTRHHLGPCTGRHPHQCGGLLPEREPAVPVAIAAGRDVHPGDPAVAARAVAAADGAVPAARRGSSRAHALRAHRAAATGQRGIVGLEPAWRGQALR
ncbi:hypothetical protein G6F68_012764 [Rhizopus microsporus]|nr:hypothetical protein G6F68_012764 [Rhizopus microsporus]